MTNEEAQAEAQRQQWRRLAAEQEGTLLFETAGETHEGNSYLFQNPLRVLTAGSAASLVDLFGQLSAALSAGFHIAGLLRYEAGYGFERVRNRPPAEEPLAWFGIYGEPEVAPRVPSSVTSLLPQPLCLSMESSRPDYLRQVDLVKRYLEAGDSYQVNLTTAVQASYRGSVLDLYNALAEQQPAPFSAFLHLPDDEHVLSFSPELFFSTDGCGAITVRPMKGTAGPFKDPAEENELRAWLANDEKNRAEHLMIVDLLRSDLGRLCALGSIHADPLFSIERYRTILQMTSTITGRLPDSGSLLEIFRALFPSGSMTGAPKPRTMELIAELESTPRGMYSGAIGFAAPGGAAVFNVAIRTVVLKDGLLRMGVGGGIVADSVAEQEHAECWLKSEFLRRASPEFDLVETMLWDEEFLLLEDHLDRLALSAEQLHFTFDRLQIRQQLNRAIAEASSPCRVRLVLERTGVCTVTTMPAGTWPAALQVRVSTESTWSQDRFLRHKTTYRPLYESEYARAQQACFDEAIFVNERGELTEGAISTLLVQVGGVWLTPPLDCGVLPGIARGRLIQTRQVQESIFNAADLATAEALAVCNAVRGIGSVQSLQWSDGRLQRFAPARTLPTLA